jgi:hypothetical protein
MADGLGMVSGSDDEDDPVASGDEGEVPAPLPLSLLATDSSTKPASPSSRSPAVATANTNDDGPAKAATSAASLVTDASKETAATTANSAVEDSDSDDDAKLTTPNQMPPHRPLNEPAAEVDTAEPFDAAKAAEMARKGVGEGVQSMSASAATGASLPAAASERTPGVVDDALRGLVLMLKGEKNDSLCKVPMCQCMHGLVKDDDGRTWPPYEITLAEARQSQFNRQTWLSVHMQEDPTRLFNTILFFNVGDPLPDPSSVTAVDLDFNANYKLQAMLPGVLVNPDDNADAAKRIAEYNETIGSTEWTFAIPVPAQFVKSMYKQFKHGLPSLYNPLTNDNVKFQLFDKVENQCSRYPQHWNLVVDKSREGQANAAAANGVNSRNKRAATGGEEGTRKRASTKPAPTSTVSTIPVTTAEAEKQTTEPTMEGPPQSPPQPHLANIQTTLRFGTATNATLVASSTESTDSTVSAAQPQPSFPLALQSSAPPFTATALSWTAITPEWFSVVVPKLPKGFVVEMSAPTTHCSGMVSFKRASSDSAVDDPDF